MSNKLLYGSICLTDIPQSLITVGKNGKKYLNVAISPRKTKGQYGETHTISVSVAKEQRKPNDTTIYIGNLKIWEGSGTTQGASTSKPGDDLPF